MKFVHPKTNRNSNNKESHSPSKPRGAAGLANRSKRSVLAVFCFLAVQLGSHAVFGQGPGGGPGGGGDHTGGPGSLRGHHGLELEHNLVLPQIAVGRDIATTLTLASLGNPAFHPWLAAEDLRTTGTVYFFEQDGNPLEVRVNGSAPVAQYRFELGASALAVLEVGLEGPNIAGWALVVIDESEGSQEWGVRDGFEVARGERVMATAFYTLTGPQGELLSRVGVVPALYQRARFFNSRLVAQFGNGVNTGVAFVNTSDDGMAAEVLLRRADGETVATGMIPLAAGQQRALFVDQLFPEALSAGFVGTLEIHTEAEGMVSMGLLMTQGILTSIPTHHFGQWQPRQGMMP